jgi:hypothetical protein
MAEPAVNTGGVDVVSPRKLLNPSEPLIRLGVNNLGFEISETYETVDGVINLSHEF